MNYQIGTDSFKRKADITSRCQAVLKTTADGQIVSHEDFCFLLALFQYHEKWATKSASGVYAITTKTTMQGTRCFALMRRDEHLEYISFPHTIKLIPTGRSASLIPQGLIDYRDAARAAVEDQVREFRDANLGKVDECPITGHRIMRSNCAVDHVPPVTFNRLLLDFTVCKGLTPLRVEIGSLDGTVAVFVDKDLDAEWRSYHKEHCHLRLLSRAGNLQLKKEKLDWSGVL